MTEVAGKIIRNLAGEIMYSGVFDTKKELIASLIAQGASFAGADLRNLDLSHLNLDGVDFTGADLSAAKLYGCTANRTIFNGATLNGTKLEGMTAKGAKFVNAKIGKKNIRGKDVSTSFDGSILTYARFDGATVLEASFENCGMAGTAFDLSTMTRCVFKDASLTNADWARAHILHCDFSGAELHASTSMNRIPRASLPDRTVDTVAVGNNYKGAVMDETIPALKWDNAFSRVSKHVAWGVSTAAMLVATSFLPIEPDGEWLGKIVGQSTVMLGLVGFLAIVKEKISEKVQDKISDSMLKVQLAVRSAAVEIAQRGGNIAHTVVAIAKGGGLTPLRKALAATKNRAATDGVDPIFKSLILGSTNIILCDRRHMAMALEWVSSSFQRTRLLQKDLVVMRDTQNDANAPSILKFFVSGGMAAFWSEGGKVVRAMEWDADDMEPMTWPVKGQPSRPGHGLQAMQARQMFEEAVMHDHMPSAVLVYDRMSEQVRAGRDGSVVITRQKDQLARNRHGAVLIQPDGSHYDEKQAKALVHLENRDNDDAAPAPGF